MVTNPGHLIAFERSLMGKDDLSFEKKQALLEAMYRLARTMGHFTHENALMGIDHDIALACLLHACVRTPPR